MFQFGILICIECACLHLIYNNADKMMTYISQEYRYISPNHKKLYVLSNFIKGGFLILFSPSIILFLYNHIFYQEWNTTFLYMYGSIYTSMDLMSVIKVPKLPLTTIFHHITVCFFFVYVVLNNLEQRSFSRLIVVYGIFSSLAGMVNVFLAMRVLPSSNRSQLMRNMSIFSLVNYMACCILNWSYQFYYLFIDTILYHSYGVLPILLYTLTLFILIRDDLILMDYLYCYESR